mmetsp:Transcript_88492/g.275137  ORF Transcript_88492/g.275137 Transcript_88492/m.275137 type:complete len:350 (-) Transcript_88492:25-1074(-)
MGLVAVEELPGRNALLGRLFAVLAAAAALAGGPLPHERREDGRAVHQTEIRHGQPPLPRVAPRHDAVRRRHPPAASPKRQEVPQVHDEATGLGQHRRPSAVPAAHLEAAHGRVGQEHGEAAPVCVLRRAHDGAAPRLQVCIGHLRVEQRAHGGAMPAQRRGEGPRGQTQGQREEPHERRGEPLHGRVVGSPGAGQPPGVRLPGHAPPALHGPQRPSGAVGLSGGLVDGGHKVQPSETARRALHHAEDNRLGWPGEEAGALGPLSLQKPRVDAVVHDDEEPDLLARRAHRGDELPQAGSRLVVGAVGGEERGERRLNGVLVVLHGLQRPVVRRKADGRHLHQADGEAGTA